MRDGAAGDSGARLRAAWTIAEEALLRPVEVRDAFITKRCGNDRRLPDEVGSLLDHLDEAGIDAGAIDDAVASEAASMIARAEDDLFAATPERLGPYRILRQIGSGGMGLVFEAWQENPRRRVAIKLLRSSAISRSSLRRFASEAQFLARLRHPGIAQVFEAGVFETISGPQPFIAMEYVDGRTLLDHVKAHRLVMRSRVELLVAVCKTVHHAHLKGVIHQDIKPSNVLVDQENRIRIVDFGVARATGDDLSATLAAANPGQIVGTVPYLSPEQVTGDIDAVDLRTDVYSLGVLAYETLAEKTPFAAEGSLAEVMTRIEKKEPRPLFEIDAAFRGDLSSIVAKAMEKRPADRYQSAAGLADDLERYLDDVPVEARRATTLQRFARSVRKNPLPALVISALFLVLLTAALVTMEMARQARIQRAVAIEQASRARLGAAAAAILEDDTALARAMLEEVSPGARGWEWKVLYARLDDSLRSFQLTRDRPEIIKVAAVNGSVTAAVAQLYAAPTLYRIDEDSELWRETGKLEGGFYCRDRSGRRWLSSTNDQLELFDLDLGRLALRGYQAGFFAVPFRGRLVSMNSAARLAMVCGDAGDGFFRCLAFGTPQLEPLARWRRRGPPPRDVRITDDGKRAYFLAVDGRVRERDPLTGKITNELEWPGARISLIDLSHDGHHLWGVVEESGLARWNLSSGRIVARETLPGQVIALATSPRGDLLASADNQSRIRIHDAVSLEMLSIHRGHAARVLDLSFDEQGASLVSADINGEVRIWPANSNARRGALLGHTSYVYAATFIGGSELIASAGWDGTIRLWNAMSEETLSVIENTRQQALYDLVSIGEPGRLATVGGRAPVRLTTWDAASGSLLRSIPIDGQPPASLDADQEGRWLAAGTEWGRGTVAVVDARTLEAVAQIPVHPVADLSFSPSGTKLAVATNHRVEIWSTETWSWIGTLEGHRSRVGRVRFSADGSMMMTASDDGTARIWDSETMVQTAALTAHGGRVHEVIFSPDGERILTGGDDGKIAVWHATTFEPIVQFRGHTDYIYEMAFSPDGTLLVSASGDGTLRLWDILSRRERAAGRRFGARHL